MGRRAGDGDQEGGLDEGDELLEVEVPLSEDLEAELEAFVLIADATLALSRAETLDILVDGLRELEDDDAIEEWVADYGDRDFHLAQERDGSLVVSDVFPVAGVVGFIPRSLVRKLSSELMDQDSDDRPGWMESLSDLSSEWLALLSDEEKMVGHLIRAHQLPVARTEDDLDELIGRHAGLHAGEDDDADDVADDEDGDGDE